MKSTALLGVLAALLVPSASVAEPWRLERALELPESLSLRVQQRFRIESVDDQFRAGRHGHDRAWASRLLVHGRWNVGGGVTLGAELLDARLWASDRSVAANTTLSNAAELLQAYAEYEGKGPGGGTLKVRAGRITMDVGSRRFVARNRFRNTINGFTGLDGQWSSPDGLTLRAFYTLPVQRQPTGRDDLRDNDVEFDEETFDLQFWGGVVSAPLLDLDEAEIFLFGLHERDRNRRPSRDRDLYTPGFRVLRKPRPGAFDFNLEAALQFGESRASAAATRDLEHFAQFYHAEVGYRFDAAFAPRVALQYDYASGDDSPNDSRNERFDTLFGARRFEFGPTSLYGAFARSNVHTPGLRVSVAPLENVTAFAAYRLYWLASDRDTWTTSGVRDPSGRTRRFVGSMLEGRLRWEVLPKNLRLELGLAHLFRGEFMRDAPNANGQGASTYAYAQTILNF